MLKNNARDLPKDLADIKTAAESEEGSAAGGSRTEGAGGHPTGRLRVLPQRDSDIVKAQEEEQKKIEAEYVERIKYKKRINKEVGRKIEEKVKGICRRRVGGN